MSQPNGFLPKEMTKSHELQTVPTMSSQEIVQYFSEKKSAGRGIGQGVALTLLAVPFVIKFPGLMGVSMMLAITAFGVARIVFSSLQQDHKRDHKLLKGQLAIRPQDQLRLKQDFEVFRQTFAKRVAVGVMSCVFSVIFFLMFMSIAPWNFFLFFGAIGFGVTQFIETGITYGAYEILTSKKRKKGQTEEIAMTCDNCDAPISELICPYCQYEH